MPCLSDVTLVNFVAGRLSKTEIDRVDAELDGCADCRQTLVALARQSLISGTEDAESAMLPIGSALGQYQLTGVLGRGGGGVVYAAHDSELQRRVAIKIVHASDSRRQRVVAEAQAMARLSHPNVVTVYEVGEDPTVGVYLVLELVEGQTLADLAATEPGWRALLDAYVQAGRGLAAAHQVDLVHRDFKPHNVLIDSQGRARVTDFGLAKAPTPVSYPANNQGSLKTESAIAGTPAYMAPEQLQGDAATTASDQYSFCKSLFCALYNQRAEIWSEVPASPVQSSRRVPRWLWPILRRGLNVDPARRYVDMDSLLSALGRRQRKTVRVGLVAVAAAVVGIGIGGYARSSPSDELVSCNNAGQHVREQFGSERLTELRRVLASAANPNAEAIASRVTETLGRYASELENLSIQTCEATYHERSQSESLHGRQKVCIDDRLLQLDALSTALTDDAELAGKAIGASLGLQALEGCTDRVTLLAKPGPLQDPTMRAQIAETRSWLANARVKRDLAQYSDALSLAEKAVARAREIAHKPTEAAALFLVAEVRGRTESPAAAKELLYDAAFAAEAARDDVTAAQVWTKLIFHTGYRQRLFDEAYRLSQHASAAIDRIGGSALLESKRLYAHSSTLHAEARYEEALTMLRRSLELIEGELGPNDPDAAATVAAIAMNLSKVGKVEEAIEFSLRGLAMREASLGPEHPDLASSHNSLGSQLGRLKRYEEAGQHLQRAIEILENSVGPEHIHVAYTLENLAELSLASDNAALALTQYRRAQTIMIAKQGADHAGLVYSLLGEGKALNKLGRQEEAETVLVRALELEPEKSDPRARAELRMALADATVNNGGRKRARALVQSAVEELKKIPDEEAIKKAEQWLREH